MNKLRPLWGHQQEAIDLLRNSLMAGHRRPMLQLPTGAGKTVIAAHVVDGARKKNKRVTFLVPAISLINQTFDRFVENGLDPASMGVMQGNHQFTRPHAPIQIATAQTLARREFPETDFVIVDEAHKRFKIIGEWMDECPEMIFVGLSATPWAKGLGNSYDDLLKPTNMGKLIDDGLLSKFQVFAPSHPDLSHVRTVRGDYDETQLGAAMDDPVLVGEIVSTWLIKAHVSGDRYLPTLVFAVNRKHAQSLAERFMQAGVSVAYIDAFTPLEDRDEIGRQLEAGDIEVVVNIGTLTTGIDWDVRCLVLARPTKSEMLFVQIVGRALRTADGKDKAMILDHSDTHSRLGLVTDIDFEGLDDGRDDNAVAKNHKKLLALPNECIHCQALMPAGAPECPECGAVPPKKVYAEHDGDLEEFGRGADAESVSVLDAVAKLGKLAVYQQLTWIAIDRDRSKGWVSWTYKEVFGVWPKGVYGIDEPCSLVRQWVRHKDIKYAKSQRKKAMAQ